MRNTNLKVILLFLSFLLFHAATTASNKPVFGVLLFPPSVFIDEETGICMGEVISLTRKILDEQSIPIDIICAPPSRLYRMLENEQIDFTMNIKSTKSLPDDIVFIETPYSTLQLNQYSHINREAEKYVAATRGFDYQGYRDVLTEKKYNFIDLPNSISAIQVFLKKRSAHLLSFKRPFDFYIKDKQLKISDTIITTTLFAVPTFYGINNASPHLDKLSMAFNHYADKHDVKYFKSAANSLEKIEQETQKHNEQR
jgi:polar amino acid transport system substrate-binding protein